MSLYYLILIAWIVVVGLIYGFICYDDYRDEKKYKK